MLQAHDLSQDVSLALETGFRIVYVDECLVSKSTIPKVEWSRLKENAKIDLSSFDTAPIAIIGAVSREFGVDLI